MLLIAFLLSKNKYSLFNAIIKVIKAFCCKQILIVFALYVAYSATLFYSAYEIGIWDFDLWKDSLLEFAFIGIPAIFVATESRSEKDLFKRVFLTEIGFAAFISFYLNLESFSILIEVAIQAAIVILMTLQTVSKNKSEYRAVYKLSTFILTAIGFFLIVSLTYQLIINFFQHDWLFELRAFFLTIWFPALVLPFLFALAYYSSFEAMYKRLGVVADDVPMLYKLILLGAFSFHMKYIKYFAGMWAFKLKDCESVKEVRNLLKEYKTDLKDRIKKEREKADLFKKGEGKRGYLQNGLWSDRTMLKKIKRELDLIGSHQATYWRNNGIYRSDIEELVEACTPAGCSSGFYVHPDGETWACWMSNPTGFTLGLGSLQGQYPPCRYEKPFEPAKEGLQNLSGFTDDEKLCPNWMYDDSINENLIN